MAKATESSVTTKTHPAVATYLLIAVGFIVGTIALIAFLFTGK